MERAIFCAFSLIFLTFWLETVVMRPLFLYNLVTQREEETEWKLYCNT